MITDSQTNGLYLSDLLQSRHPEFYSDFEKSLKQLSINVSFLTHTKDIWAVDYMPVQVKKDYFVQFVYEPDYLRKSAQGRKSITDSETVCKAIGISSVKSDVLIDGGNVVRSSNKVILCDKVLVENPSYSVKKLRQKLISLFEVEEVILIPTDPADPVGHADGMLRFVDDNTVLINNYNNSDAQLMQKLVQILRSAGLNIISIPYNPYANKGKWDASGIYMNYLHMSHGIVLPVFNRKEDEAAIRQFEKLFPSLTIATVESSSLAEEGGILNCISWNILK